MERVWKEGDDLADKTPMMQQYWAMKKQYPDSILFFRLGDFYEMFDEDARVASKELDLTLTSRDHGKRNKPEEERIPMCGVPYHASEGYIAKLIAKGYKVAICEQLENPADAKGGLVKRDIIRVVTPGTVIDAACLEDKAGNFLCGVYLDKQAAGVAFCDVTTGETCLTGVSGAERAEHILNELSRFMPAEAILNPGAAAEEILTNFLTEKLHCRMEYADEKRFQLSDAEKNIRRQFGDEAWKNLPQDNPTVAMALGGLLRYLYETQKTDLSHMNRLDYYKQGRFMELDPTARRNLELTETLRNKEKKGSLLWVLDRTRTPMGGRMLRSFLERPLLSISEIRKRNTAVSVLVQDTIHREELIAAMAGLGDMERLIGRIVYGTAGGRDFASLRSAIERLPDILEQIKDFRTGRLGQLAKDFDILKDIGEKIKCVICDEPPFSIREGGFIRDGFHEEVDRLRNILSGGKDFLAELEAREKNRTGIRTLKVGYNKVFGYYIEVSKSFADQVPTEYIRKQTLANGERYITPELKQLEQEILTADQRLTALEYELFMALRQEIADQSARVQKTAASVAELDALASLASVAVRDHYCCPVVDDSGVIEIQNGRHPVVERVLRDIPFVPNDTFMGAKEHRTAIITGPNMAGKSTYMRQVALIVLMAQMGSFVPAESAHIGIVDRIFTRIGASDDLSAGQSTFMVEMTEVADILRHATKHSLLILDEIGRGTSTFDGMSIARAVLEYCADPKKLGAKTLFATHYHELTELEESLPGAVNYSIAVKARGEEIIFLRKIIPGGADKSYGIEVAKLAGLPDRVIRRAKIILKELEEANGVSYINARKEEEQVSLTALGEGKVLDALRRCQLDTMTPVEALAFLDGLKRELQ